MRTEISVCDRKDRKGRSIYMCYMLTLISSFWEEKRREAQSYRTLEADWREKRQAAEENMGGSDCTVILSIPPSTSPKLTPYKESHGYRRDTHTQKRRESKWEGKFAK